MRVDIPADVKSHKPDHTLVATLPICGVITTAIVTHRSFAEVRAYYASQKRSNWKGALYDFEIMRGIKELGAKSIRSVTTNVIGRTLKEAVRRLDSNSVYVCFVNGHVCVIHKNKVMDQSGVVDPEKAWCARRYVWRLYEVEPGRNDVHCYAVASANATPVKKIAAPKSGSQLGKAYEVFKRYQELKISRIRTIRKIAEHCAVSEATATVYYYKCSKVK